MTEEELKALLEYNADRVREAFPQKQVDVWLLAGFRNWAKRRYGKRQNAPGSTILDKRLKTLTKNELGALIDYVRAPKKPIN